MERGNPTKFGQQIKNDMIGESKITFLRIVIFYTFFRKRKISLIMELFREQKK